MRTKEQQRIYNQTYKNKNREKISLKKKLYYEQNKERIREYKFEYHKRNKERAKKKREEYYSSLENRIKKIYWKARERAHKENLEFSIEMSDIVIPEVCPYLGIKLTHELGSGQLITNSSLDRIDSTKGYIKGNIQVISRLANTMKSNADIPTLVSFAKGVLNVHKVY